MTDFISGIVIAITFTLLGNALGDNLTIIDCATKGTAKLNGTTIECTVQKGQQP